MLDCFKLSAKSVFSEHKHARNVALKWLNNVFKCKNIWDQYEPWTHPIEHADDVLCVVEAADLVVAPAVDDRHRLQTQTLHVDLGREQETVVEVVEELVAGGTQTAIL